MDDLAAIARLVDALRPWREQLVIVGGWAHRLHRFHPWAGAPDYAPLRTKDADVAFSLDAAPTGDIRSALLAAEFTEVLSGDHRPPIAEYRLGDEHEGFFAEFLAPLKGSGVKRNGAEDATVERAGVTAQKLRHLDLLLTEPLAVRLDAKGGVPLRRPADVLVANPVSFIVQKLLIRRSRKPDKQAQDALYIHDTIELSGNPIPGHGSPAGRSSVKGATRVIETTRAPRRSRGARTHLVNRSCLGPDGVPGCTSDARSCARVGRVRLSRPRVVSRAATGRIVPGA
jgi:hypothetical protein